MREQCYFECRTYICVSNCALYIMLHGSDGCRSSTSSSHGEVCHIPSAAMEDDLEVGNG